MDANYFVLLAFDIVIQGNNLKSLECILYKIYCVSIFKACSTFAARHHQLLFNSAEVDKW